MSAEPGTQIEEGTEGSSPLGLGPSLLPSLAHVEPAAPGSPPAKPLTARTAHGAPLPGLRLPPVLPAPRTPRRRGAQLRACPGGLGF